MQISACRNLLCRLALGGAFLLTANALATAATITDIAPDGALDRSYPELQRTPQPAGSLADSGVSRLPVASTDRLVNNGQVTAPFNLDDIRREVQREQTELEQLNRDTLLNRAQQGERAAQIALGVDFAKESLLLGFAPAAANDALSDAIRWYSLAARRGYPGAPSLDQSGVRFFPVRAARETRR